MTQVTLHPVVIYFKHDDSLQHKSIVFVSDKPRDDANLVFGVLTELNEFVKEALPTETSYIHYWTDSPTSKYRNKKFFNVICNHEEYFNIPASWNYMEARNGKGPCDPIGGVAKRNADIAVKQQEEVIQDANSFFAWAKNVDFIIEYCFISTAAYEENKRFLDKASNKVKPVEGTIKIHCVVKSLNENMLWVRETSCYNKCCFSSSGFKYQMFCSGWQEVSLPKKFTNKDSLHQE